MASSRLGVRIGNWLEDEYAHQDLLRDFIRKREQGQLLVQRLARLQENIFKRVELSVSSDGFVHFGDTVLLKNPDNKSLDLEGTSEEKDPEMCGDVTLAVDMEEVSLYSDEPLQISRGLSAVKRVDPIGRNTFCIVSADGSAVGEPLRYGQNFLLGTKGGVSDKLFYLASDHKTFKNFAKKSRLQKVFLTAEVSYLAVWQAKSLDPQLRLEHEGFPVPADTKIIITHCYTNRNLAVPRTFCVWSYFGREFEVICHNYLDTHKVEEDKNHWEMITANPGPEDGTMLDRPKAFPEGYKKELDS
ncbi:PREDICTED: cilia- and flagella-associated protein 161 [Ficedula albicollis]|uniref:Cilia and flagella associated protein 161 n=1 Tax=Ficedula albicollis TaxID=59894 RepID=U3JTH9_FICAL|nr:PREDICTED: cilia- and flagella-associated protein 161 [Ficedula albicollis]